MTIDLYPQRLTRERFAVFGDVIDCTGEPLMINNGTTERYHDLARIDVANDGGRPLLNIFRGQPFTPPVRIGMMERHPLGSQAFVPLSACPFLLVVARPGNPPAPEDLTAFIAESGQGINYARGTWHYPLLSLHRISDYLVVDRGAPEIRTTGENLDEHYYPDETEIWLQSPELSGDWGSQCCR